MKAVECGCSYAINFAIIRTHRHLVITIDKLALSALMINTRRNGCIIARNPKNSIFQDSAPSLLPALVAALGSSAESNSALYVWNCAFLPEELPLSLETPGIGETNSPRLTKSGSTPRGLIFGQLAVWIVNLDAIADIEVGAEDDEVCSSGMLQ